GPSNIAYAPATTIQTAPRSGVTRARASTLRTALVASARSRRCDRARSANGIDGIQKSSAKASAAWLKPSRYKSQPRAAVSVGAVGDALDGRVRLRLRREDLFERGHEASHLGLGADRDAHVLRHRRERTADRHLLRGELLDDRLDLAADLDHEEIGLGRQRLIA